VSISAAALSADGTTVTLTTSKLSEGTRYTLTVNGVKDASLAGNQITAGSTADFSGFVLGTGYLTWQSYNNIGTGVAITDLTSSSKFPDSPDETLSMNWFDSRTVRPDDSREGYGARVTGWFTPETSGQYRFFLRSDDASQLFLSTDATEANKVMIAEQTGCCNAFTTDTSTSKLASDPITLTAGQHYYIEGLLKEGGGGDYIKVAVKGPGEDLDVAPATSGDSVVDQATIPGRLLSTYVDPDATIQITQQPTDQLGSVASPGVEVLKEDFNSGDGGFTVDTTGTPPGPWEYDSASGAWVAKNGNDACGDPNNSALNSAPMTMSQDGALTLKFSHRYSFEPTWDGGQVRISVNGGDFAAVPAGSFLENGYANGAIVGNGVLLNQNGFTDKSAGYDSGEFITSTCSLGTFKKGDTVAIQFLAAWDECTTGDIPNWVIDSYSVSLLPMLIQDFADGDGGYTVDTQGTPPGPWEYDSTDKIWTAKNGNDACGDPNSSMLISGNYVAPQDDEVTLSFVHRYSFEPTWDGGAVQVSVNGGPFTDVPPTSFAANGYSDTVVGNGIMNGKMAFTGDSSGYGSTNFITSKALLGDFKKGDTIAVRFVAAWDECSTGSIPNWQIKYVALSFGRAASASTFQIAASGTLHGDSVQVRYQWQRDDGNGFVDIPMATSNTLTFYPTPADLIAKYRVVLTTPGGTVTSDEVNLVTSAPPTAPELSISVTGGTITIQFTGTLQSSPTVDGTYQDVPGAQSPYTVPDTSQVMFFRSAK
jgi:hypothetical protein